VSRVSESVPQSKPRPDASNPTPPAKAVDFGALAAKAAASRVPPQKEALISALLSRGKSFRPKSQDTAAFDTGMSVVEETLPHVVDE
jgi:hypothetical protein